MIITNFRAAGKAIAHRPATPLLPRGCFAHMWINSE